MLHNIDFRQEKYRLLFNTIVQKIEETCLLYSLDKSVATDFVARLFKGDPSILLLVELDSKFGIASHCLVTIEPAGGQFFCFIQQLETKFKKDSLFLKEVFEYLENLKLLEPRINKISFFTSLPRFKTLAKFGFVQSNIIVEKEIKQKVLEIG